MQSSNYIAKKPDAKGLIHYTDEEHGVWNKLYVRQIELIKNRACQEFIDGVGKLGLTADRIPQCVEVNKRLQTLTGWSVSPVEALISFEEFYQLLAAKKFPAASFIRRIEELDYLKEPDIFHELFGHCPMLTHQAFADFTQTVGELGMQLDSEDRVMLARLYWFTVEFGLLRTPQGLRIYGGGILSSIGETVYSLENDIPNRLEFDLLTVLRMPYRYDEMQLNYFILNNLDDLYHLIDKQKLARAFTQAKQLGLLPNPHDKPIEDLRSC